MNVVTNYSKHIYFLTTFDHHELALQLETMY